MSGKRRSINWAANQLRGRREGEGSCGGCGMDYAGQRIRRTACPCGWGRWLCSDCRAFAAGRCPCCKRPVAAAS